MRLVSGWFDVIALLMITVSCEANEGQILLKGAIKAQTPVLPVAFKSATG